MTVYVVEQGCYSDRYVAGIFSSRELAEAYIAQHGPNGDWNESGTIEEYAVDAYAGHVNRQYFTCSIDLETGEIFRQYSGTHVTDPNLRGEASEVSDLRKFKNLNPQAGYGRISQTVTSHESPEHAHKLAAAARQAWLRTRLETPPA